MTARKIMLLGDISVGKTSIVRRLVFDKFQTNYKVTINVDIYKFEIDDAGPKADQRVELIIWDTDGNMADSIFRQQNYMAGASAALIVGDITRAQSLETMLRLSDLCQEKIPGRHVTFVLNKIDLLEGDTDPDLPRGFADISHPVVRMSAKTGENVRLAFRDAATAILRRAP
jgi:small GTP-binding protein